jgi:glycosyltransferase involved in cell wall biosynthesis
VRNPLPVKAESGPRSAFSVVHLTSVHDHTDHRIFYKECRTLAAAGFQVTLIAPKDTDEVIDGITVRAVAPGANRVERMTRTVWDVYRAAVQLDADLYHFHDPELILVGILLKLRGRRVVYDVHEDMTRTMLRKGWLPAPLLPLMARAIAIVESVAVRLLDATVLVIPMERPAFRTGRCVLVRNFPIDREFPPAGPPYRERSPLAVYVGGIGVRRGAKDMVRAMGLLPAVLNARLAIAGWFQPLTLENDLRALPGFERVDLLGNRSREDVATLLSEARIGLCMLHPVPGYPESYPVKLFEYMAAGIPVIASDFPLWRAIVEGADCGILVDPGEPAALADSLTFLLRNPELAEEMGNRGRRAMADRYHWGPEGRRLVALYDRLLAGSRARGSATASRARPG